MPVAPHCRYYHANADESGHGPVFTTFTVEEMELRLVCAIKRSLALIQYST